jgi:transcriptional regulator of acetoin/glycerol metabolism
LDKLKEAHLSSQKAAVMEALEKAKGNVGRAAEILGKHRNWIHALVKKHKLEKFVARLRYEAINGEL